MKHWFIRTGIIVLILIFAFCAACAKVEMDKWYYNNIVQ